MYLINTKLHFSVLELYAYLHTQEVNLHDQSLATDVPEYVNLDIKSVLSQLITHISTTEFTFAPQATNFVEICTFNTRHHKTQNSLVPTSFTFCYILSHKCLHQAQKHSIVEYCQYFTALTDYFDLLQNSYLNDY